MSRNNKPNWLGKLEARLRGSKEPVQDYSRIGLDKRQKQLKEYGR